VETESSLMLDVEIERILPGGVGLAHAAGKTIFVALAAPGDCLRVTIDRQQGNVSFASIEEILKPSPVRVEPPCPYFGRCGGCDFQQMTYEAQLEAKAEMIRDCLHRIARLETPPEIVVQASPKEWRYRARATWQVDRDEERIGYYERASRRVCDVADCAVLVPDLQGTLEQVRATPIGAFPAGLKHIEVVAGANSLTQGSSYQSHSSVNVNESAPVSLAPEFAQFHTSEVSLKVGDEAYCYNAEAFFQINQDLIAPLIASAVSNAGGDYALDLYSGVGLFTLPLARSFRRVIGVEANHVASRFARRNLQQAQLTSARVVTVSVADWLRANSARLGPIDFILLDPPRAGAESTVIRSMLDLRPAHISYVSCDPATLARDLKKLFAGGYAVDSIEAFDMFPQTHHVETVARLSRSVDT
jgi:23S rRNA (uracil1939-C5)-methyltransferase